jgi:hypothetical protein
MSTRIESEKITENKGFQAELARFDGGMPVDLKAESLAGLIERCEETIAATQTAKTNLAAVMDAKHKAFEAMDQCVKRVRSSVKGMFGDDSLEFERVGGKRSSDPSSTVGAEDPKPELNDFDQLDGVELESEVKCSA